MPIAQADIIVDASAADVMAVLVDYASYPDFLPNIRSVEVIERGPQEWRVSFVIRIIRDLQYTLRLVRDGDRRLSWSLTEEGVFLQNSGAWVLTEHPDGRTRAEQRLEIQVAVFLPNSIARSLVERTLPQTVACLRDEIERRKTRAK